MHSLTEILILQAMLFISVLLALFAYIFAIIGVMFFRDGYKDAEIRNPGVIHYKDSFR